MRSRCMNKGVIGCFCDSLLTFVICALYFFYIYIKLPLYTIGKFTCILITLGIALRQIWLHGTARRAEQSFSL